MVQVQELDAKLAEQKRTRWANPLVIAVFAAAAAAAGNGVVAVINGIYQRDLEKTRSDAQIDLEMHRSKDQHEIEEAKAEAARILEVIKTADPEKAAENLDFLLKAGLIVNKKRQDDLRSFLDNRQFGEGPNIPPGGISIDIPNYNLSTPPKDPSQTQAAYRLLQVAIAEINKNIHEAASPGRVLAYFRSVGLGDIVDATTAPWSSALVSWLIQASGYKDSFKPSAAGILIWNEAVAKKLTFLPGEKPVLPGDIVVLSRSSSADLTDLRSGKSFSPTQPGIVYAVDKDKFTIIGGNVHNAIRLEDHTFSDRIIGYIRLSDG